MPSNSRIALTVSQKLELKRKLKKGAGVLSVCEENGVAKQTVLGIRKSKDKKLYILLKTASFYLQYISTFVLSRFFHYPSGSCTI